MNQTAQKYKNLQLILMEMGNVTVAYSGGVDSTFLLKVGTDVLKENCLGVLAVSPTYPSREYERALDVATSFGARIKIIETHEMEDKNFVDNPVNRCYFCKSELFEVIAGLAGSEGFINMVDGSNFDDLGDHRPGMKALRERKVRSPLQEAELTKSEIRELSRILKLPTWNKDALACLSSRFPYGEKIDLEKLRMVDRAEEFLYDMGFRNLRARHTGKNIKIEVSPEQISRFFQEEIRTKVLEQMKSIGYKHVSIDLEGYRQGSLNEGLLTATALPEGSSREGLRVDL